MTAASWKVRRAHVGTMHREWLSDGSWEDDGFLNGNPIRNGDTVAKWEESDFDVDNEDHRRLACAYATSDGRTDRNYVYDWLRDELGLTDEQIDEHLADYFAGMQ